MGLGKQVRLNRIFSHPSGRLCSVAIDHFIGYQEGMPAGLYDLPKTLAALVAGRPDAVTMHKGAALACWGPHAGQVPLIVQSLIGRPDDSADELLATPEDAVRLGADAFATCAFVKGFSEAAHLKRAADLVRQAEKLEMPVVLHIYPRRFHHEDKADIVFDAESVAWAVRCGMEVGVDVIKTPFCGDAESFGQIVRACPVPVVAAGGPKTTTLEQALVAMQKVVASGARGATIGRNIWSHEEPTKALLAFKAVIHDNATSAEALAAAGLP